jgi:hypothetical protein
MQVRSPSLRSEVVAEAKRDRSSGYIFIASAPNDTLI